MNLNKANINWTRKPSDWNEVSVSNTDFPLELLASLPMYDADDVYTDKHPSEPQFYLLCNAKGIFLADCQGYDYPKYMVKIQE